MRPLHLAVSTGTAQIKWAKERRGEAYTNKLPEQFGDVLIAIAALTGPILDDGPTEAARWNPGLIFGLRSLIVGWVDN